VDSSRLLPRDLALTKLAIYPLVLISEPVIDPGPCRCKRGICAGAERAMQRQRDQAI